jgi:hypothetical protein
MARTLFLSPEIAGQGISHGFQQDFTEDVASWPSTNMRVSLRHTAKIRTLP